VIDSLRKIWPLLGQQARLNAAVLGLVLCVAALLEMASIGLFLPFLQVVVAPDSVSGSAIGRALMEAVSVLVPSRSVAGLGGLLVAFFVVKNLLLLGGAYLQTRITRMGEAELASRLFAAYLEKPWAFFLDRNSAEIVRNVLFSTAAVFNGVLLAWIRLLSEAVLALAAAVVLFAVEPVGTLAAGVAFAAIFGGYYLGFRQALLRWGKAREELAARRIRGVNEMFAVLKEIKLFGRETHFAAEFRDLSFADGRIATNVGVAGQAPRLIGEIATALTLLVVILVVLQRMPDPADVIPVLGVFAAAALRIMPAFNRGTIYAADIRHRLAAVDNVHRDYVAHVRDSAPSAIPRVPFVHALELDGVSYRYPGAAVPALSSVSLRLERGEAVALIGRSGAGKSTLADIALGLLPPAAGIVRVDGAPIAAGETRRIERVAYVPQTVVLLDDTLRRNVAFGVADGDIDETRVHRALAASRLSAVVARLPDGLDAVLGERGARLSGGERQRVGIARALYVEPELIVLDEPTAALDEETEAEVAATISALKRRCAVLVVAHRPKTVAVCDRIVFLREGRIVDAGAPAAILGRHDRLEAEIQ
jgi:ATP-binding cassette subfamily C protein